MFYTFALPHNLFLDIFLSHFGEYTMVSVWR